MACTSCLGGKHLCHFEFGGHHSSTLSVCFHRHRRRGFHRRIHDLLARHLVVRGQRVARCRVRHFVHRPQSLDKNASMAAHCSYRSLCTRRRSSPNVRSRSRRATQRRRHRLAGNCSGIRDSALESSDSNQQRREKSSTIPDKDSVGWHLGVGTVSAQHGSLWNFQMGRKSFHQWAKV